MTDAVFVGAVSSARRKHAVAWYVFVALVSAASLFPMVAFPFTRLFIPRDESALTILAVLFFLGSHFHVGLTGWFYTDPVMRSHFRAQPLRYVVVPCILVVGSTALFAYLDYAVCQYVLLAFFGWQLWHYQKQNFGVLSFIAAGTDGTPLSPWERRTLYLAAISGILGYFQLNGVGQGLPNLSTAYVWLHQAGLVVACLLPVTFGLAVLSAEALRTNWLRLIFFLFGTLFFLPLYLFDDPASAIFGYAVAHGLQYVVFMAFVGAKRPFPIASLATMSGIAIVYAVFASWLADNAPFPALSGLFVGLVSTHFVLDAGIWRLREPFQRKYMREKFNFIFER
jgi:hypothetical protein